MNLIFLKIWLRFAIKTAKNNKFFFADLMTMIIIVTIYYINANQNNDNDYNKNGLYIDTKMIIIIIAIGNN